MSGVILVIQFLMFVHMLLFVVLFSLSFFFFQAEDGIRDLVRSRGLGDVYKRQVGPQHKQHAVGEVEHVHQAEDKRQARRHQEIERGLSLIHI